MNGMNMKVFRAKTDNGRNFRIENIEEENLLWKDFWRRGNPAKNVPPGGDATFCVKFNAPDAGDAVIQQLEEMYDVHTSLIVPKDDQDFKPYKAMKIACRFDMFPPTIVLHAGPNDIVLSHFVQKANKTDKVPQEIVDEFNGNMESIQRIYIDHINVDVNVSQGGKPYVSSMDIWQAVDGNGELRYWDFGKEYEEMIEHQSPTE